MSYIENVANKFGGAINEVVIDQLVQVLEDEIGLSKIIEEENEKAIAENTANIAKLKAKAEDAEQAAEYDNLQPSLINVKDKQFCLNFGFERLLADGKTLLHNLDESGNLTIKVFKLEKTRTRKIKTSYNVTYE
jgi:hypothetical protein